MLAHLSVTLAILPRSAEITHVEYAAHENFVAKRNALYSCTRTMDCGGSVDGRAIISGICRFGKLF